MIALGYHFNRFVSPKSVRQPHRQSRPCRLCSVVGAVALMTLPCSARADYILTPLSAGYGSATRSPGDMLTLDLVLSSASGLVHNSAIFSVEFSSSGLEYLGYQWSPPYGTGTILDDSLPRLEDLPTVLTEGTLAGPGYPEGIVDVELSNVAEFGSAGVGVLATLQLRIPEGFAAPQTVWISTRPDTFALGFSEIPTLPGTAFELVIVPAPAASVVLVFSAHVLVARRRPRPRPQPLTPL